MPASSGAILLDQQGRLLILKPTYKKGWTVPGGIMEDDGESPWDGCRREVREETGLTVTAGRLVVVDTRPGDPGEPVGLRFLFHCGTLTAEQAASIVLQKTEISQARFVTPAEANKLLRPAIGRRVAVGLRTPATAYLEDGQQVAGVSPALPQPPTT